ncbi:PknH-like extracellular domain-containing protein OS=Tsukamurella paurometabola (strain ATCC 8368/ DSM / CCUG 35730 / CIP 100753 / JCM 10117 / KCTC 9821/ NBRC 16120 / NCIMB 702349 / NCTC 13040) OX=521096 GN=Tpau_1769 PE=4 SV=1 [Tsukamurella paurometabola]|uniref:PknH-like extracellular domain-containing protein n=1 Tax=Tsukamurella paurometabola (strain ATCC 8368 / DSM 20162 / CCUG 35730 / CIP 100753 / JCM 10117 / KCTC 9821 / NBRC 16120 / NCIMB 702349 / NCTC 13040) TaxID=521096 RepID=D5UMA7_TSUPD|nr:hypothetical protein [Tsukamurella paurometabola]ADG78387.1 hypothetical protein Tpau_1769 [Tsukamurella paurometabola DSM 20162]SUP31444.1 Uncharacterised protein [Tsukamurella paurometabola]
MTVNTARARTRLAVGAVVATITAAGSLVSPVASAAPVSTNLLLGPDQFPSGSTDYRVNPSAATSKVRIPESAPADCRAAGDSLNSLIGSVNGAEASARNGYSFMTSAVLSPVVTSQWRAVVDRCEGGQLATPPDLARYNPVILTANEGGRIGAVQGFADVNGYTVNAYVEGMSATPANTDRFWAVFRAQIQKVQTGR